MRLFYVLTRGHILLISWVLDGLFTLYWFLVYQVLLFSLSMYIHCVVSNSSTTISDYDLWFIRCINSYSQASKPFVGVQLLAGIIKKLQNLKQLYILYICILFYGTLDSKQIYRSVDLPVCTKTDHTSLFSYMKITFGSNGFIDQWINSYALRQTKLQCLLIWFLL